MKLPLVVALVLSSCSPVYAFNMVPKDRATELATLEVHLEVTQNVLKDLRETLAATNTTLQGISITLTTIQNNIDRHTERIEKLEQIVTKQGGTVAALEDEKKKLDNLLTFLYYLSTATVVVLGFFKRSHIKSAILGIKKNDL
jgi:septal ring factor EnvC (AmiA/AmiB activator)